MSTTEDAEKPEPVHDRLLRDIVAGAYPAGSVIAESALTLAYGVSRTPVREAVSRLEQDGLLRRVSRGYEVPIRSAQEIFDLYETRIALESAAIAAAARIATPGEVAALRQLHMEIEAETDAAETARLNRQWHRAAVAAGHNAVIEGFLEKVYVLIDLYTSPKLVEAGNLQSIDHEHGDILDAVIEGDPDAARVATVAHLERVRDLRMALWTRRQHDRR